MKIYPEAPKIPKNFLEESSGVESPNKILGTHEKDFRVFRQMNLALEKLRIKFSQKFW